MRTIAVPLGVMAVIVGCATAAPNLERNKEIARRAFSEILEKGRFELVRELYAPDFRNGSYTLDEDMAALREWHRVLPRGFTMRPELMVAEGDYVSVLWSARATLDRGRKLSAGGITIWKIVGGRIREEWSQFDEEGLRRQLGLAPAPESAGAK